MRADLIEVAKRSIVRWRPRKSATNSTTGRRRWPHLCTSHRRRSRRRRRTDRRTAGTLAACVHVGLARSREEGRLVGVFSTSRSFGRGSSSRARRSRGLEFGGLAGREGTDPSLQVRPAGYRHPAGRRSSGSIGGEKFGSVVAISLDHRTIDIKKRGDTAERSSGGGLRPQLRRYAGAGRFR